jgi:protein O-mannosyl-transferase
MNGRRQLWLGAAVLAGAVLLVYLPVLNAGFIWDDDKHLTENPCVVGPLGFAGIWTTAAATYYPLVLTTFWIEHALWGLAPLPYHLVNVLVHAACGVLLWRVLARLRVPGAWLGAALWALHPVQVESVAWVTELKNTQSCFFFLLAILFFLKWKDGWTDYALALLFAAAAILSKSSTVMLPVVLGLCRVWDDGRWRWRDAIPLAPFFAISGLASAWTIWEQKFHSGAVGADWALTVPQRLIVAGRVVWFYLGKLAWPHPLIFIYPRWQVDASQALAYLPALAALGALLFLWWRSDGLGRPVFFAAAYFAVSLFPVLGFFNVYYFRFSFVGDHLQYLASIGPLALAGAAIARLPHVFGRSHAA